jgi:transcriptional regulator with XRE-family HTH domain
MIFGRFLRAMRGDTPLLEFGRRIGVSDSTVFRLENFQSSLTFRLADQILDRLHCTWDEMLRIGATPAPGLVRETPATYRVAAPAASPAPKPAPKKPKRHAPRFR